MILRYAPNLIASCCTVLTMLLGFAAQCCAQSQMEINQSAWNDYKKADAELNKVYQQIRQEYKKETVFLIRLKEVQEAWVVYRDAELEALFPTANKNDDKTTSYGSVYPLCQSVALTRLTEQRTKELKRWLKGVEEGDVCCGSVRVNSK